MCLFRVIFSKKQAYDNFVKQLNNSEIYTSNSQRYDEERIDLKESAPILSPWIQSPSNHLMNSGSIAKIIDNMMT